VTTSEPPPAERLQRYLAKAGLGSRRACDELIGEGRVMVDGVVAEVGRKITPGVERVTVDGRTLEAQPKEYWLLNKPAGVVATAKDTHGRPTVVDLVAARGRVFPVGRLDMDTTGVLVLTNDGEFAHALIHPRHEVVKEYEVTVRGRVSAQTLDRLRRGVELEDGLTLPAEVDVLQEEQHSSVIRLRLREGRKRQVRRMLKAVGHRVVALNRSHFGPLSAGGLDEGASRELTDREVGELLGAARRV